MRTARLVVPLLADSDIFFKVAHPLNARVLMEIRAGGKLIGSTRAIFRSRPTIEAIVRDPAPCEGGCVHWKTRNL